MGSQNSTGNQPVCLLDATNSNRCTGENPVISYLKHIDPDQVALREHSAHDTSTFRRIGDELVSRNVLQESVNQGKCFKVSRQLDRRIAEDEERHLAEDAANWLCEDDLENYWQNNCLVILPAITTCMDEMAILKHTGDVQHLEDALDLKRAIQGSQSESQ